ncbi:MAG: mercuric transport protein MerTP [Bacteroidetes bacterium]|nr:MAG: mercuric transport protein MerTP [Bacteroidota bacterium]
MRSEKSSKKLLGAGIMTAIAASLCCITPVLALVAGSSGIASSFSWLEPARPFFIGITIVVIGFAWYQKLKPRKADEIDCACEEDEEKTPFMQTKTFLGIVTVFSALMLAFPYYSGSFFPENNKQVVIVGSTEKEDEPEEEIMIIKAENVATVELDIKGMTCPACNYTVQNAALDVPGVFESTADYNTGKALVKYDKSKANEEEIINSINTTEYEVIGKNNGGDKNKNDGNH